MKFSFFWSYRTLLFLTAILPLSISCKKQLDKTENIIKPALEVSAVSIAAPAVASISNTYILGHKGAGSNNYNTVNMEHSMASINEALSKNLDGVEVDVQMSLDSTLWLFHDTNLTGNLCSTTSSASLINMHDKEIAALKLCSRTKHDRVYKLSELIDLWNNTKNGFFITFEIKGDFSAATYKAVGGKDIYLKKLASRFALAISKLKHPASQFMIQNESISFAAELRKFPVGNKIKYFLFEFLPFDKCVADAIKYKFDGVSCSFTDKTIDSTKIKNAQSKKLLVQIWSPYTTAEVLAVYNQHPDFIQTDHSSIKKDLGIK